MKREVIVRKTRREAQRARTRRERWEREERKERGERRKEEKTREGWERWERAGSVTFHPLALQNVAPLHAVLFPLFEAPAISLFLFEWTVQI